MLLVVMGGLTRQMCEKSEFSWCLGSVSSGAHAEKAVTLRNNVGLQLPASALSQRIPNQGGHFTEVRNVGRLA